MRFLIALTLVLLPATAHAQMDRSTTAFVWMVPLYTWQSVVDAKTTTQCVQAGRCREVNPVWLALAQNHGIEKSMRTKFYTQTAITVGAAIAMHKWPEKKPLIVASYAVLLAGQVWVNHHNAQVLK